MISPKSPTGDALRQDEQQFSLLADNAPVFIWISGPDKSCTWFNKPWLEFVGRSMEQEIGNGWAENVHPDDVERCFSTYAGAFERREPFTMEYRLRRRDGVYRWMLESANPSHRPDGSFIGYIGSCVDITERREAEERFRRSQVHSQLTTEAAQVGTWQWNIDTNELFWSAIHKQLWGYEPTPEPIQYEDWACRLYKEDLRRVEEFIEKCRRGAAEYDVEYRVVPRGSSETRWIRSKGRAEFNPAGEATFMHGVSFDVSDRKRAETALRDREERLRAIVDTTPECVKLVAGDGTLIQMNISGLAMVGATRADMVIGKNVYDLIAPEHRDAFRAFNERICRGEKGSMEFDIVGLQGRRRRMESHSAPLRDIDGKVVHLAITRDITERKRAENLLAEAMRQQEALYQFVERRQRSNTLEEIHEAALDAILSALRCQRASILLYDGSGFMRFVAWRGLSDDYRSATEGHSPWSREETNPRPLCIADVAASNLDDSLKEVVIREGIGALAFIPLLVNGRLIGKFMIYYREPHHFYDEEVELCLTISGQLALGIERMRAEQSLVESEQRFRTLADHAPVLIWLNGPTGCEFVNQNYLEFLGVTMADVQEMDWAKYIHPDDYKRYVGQYLAVSEKRATFEAELRFRRADGVYRRMKTVGTPRFSPTRDYLGYVGCTYDVEDEKRAQEELLKLNLLLENIVAERTYELRQANGALLRDMEERKKLEEQLLQAQKMEGIGTLAGGIAHDFNNILNIIQGYASSLSEYGNENKEVGDCLTIINETVQRGAALVQQLLTLARKSGSHWEPVNANAVIEKLIALIGQTFPKTIELSTSLEPELPPIMADKNQIEQALLNLCVNARDAMPGGGRLVLRTKSSDRPIREDTQIAEEDEEKRSIVIEVSDNGVGMEDGVRRRIFEPFFTTKDTGQGTGLGLSVVYGIVNSHNGTIDVASRPEHGTTFRLLFPVVPVNSNSGPGPTTPMSLEAGQPFHGGAILLVEDEKPTLYLVQKFLLRCGYRVFIATDGEEALEVYDRHRGVIDAILLDIGLPKIDGLDVLRQLRERNDKVKVIIASGYLDPALKSAIDTLHIQYFVEKPYRLEQLVDIVESVIKGRASTGLGELFIPILPGQGPQ